MSPSHHLKTETDLVSETLSFLVIYNSGRWTKSLNPMILGVIHHRQNSLHSTNLSSLILQFDAKLIQYGHVTVNQYTSSRFSPAFS
jgi:hypothetical protein